jgi:sugar diacid utilization regulator
VLEQAGAVISRVAAGTVRSAAADVGPWKVRALDLGEGTPRGVFVTAGARPLSTGDATTLAEAAHLIRLRWSADDAVHHRRRLALAEARNREAVLHLLMVGDVSGARRSAAAIGPPLPDVTRVYLVECPADARDEAARRCVRDADGRAFMVRCPVYSRHIIVLAQAAPASDAGQEEGDSAPSTPIRSLDDALREFAAGTPGVYVGAGHAVGLDDIPNGHAQAFHALAVARNNSRRYASFTAKSSISELLGDRGRKWARETLKPLLDYVPDRRQDPSAHELIVTLGAWLDLYAGAAAQLKIHRNTLAARLRRIEGLIGHRLDDVRARGRTSLALRLLDHPLRREPGTGVEEDVTLESLLDTPEVHRWAASLLAPLLRPEHAMLQATVRVWLDNNTRIEPTSSELGISVAGVRRRLARVEQLLERSLLNGPSARYDLWLALSVHDRERA